MPPCNLDSNNFIIGNHFFKVLVQIHYSRCPVQGFHFIKTFRAFVALCENGFYT